MEQSPEAVAEAARGWDRPAVMVPILALLSLVGGQFPSFSLSANLYTLGIGGVLVWLGLSNRVARRPVRRRLGPGIVWWAVPVAVFGFFEGVTFVADAGHDFPTFSRLADPVLEDPLARSVAYFGWLTAFWVLVRR
ncbi:MAG TPA: hypothetical protein VGD43_17650 [Micromonospora sp.]